MKILDNIKLTLSNLPGLKTNRKFVVFESDDWGSIRMPDLQTQNYAVKKNLISLDDPYMRYDTLENENDLVCLFEVLNKFKDIHGNHPKFTFYMVQANPDFQNILNSNYSKYQYRSFAESYIDYNKGVTLKVLKEGINEQLVLPQFHCREHVNVPLWMHYLKNNHSGVRNAFSLKIMGASFHDIISRKKNFQAAWDFNNKEQLYEVSETIVDGLRLFKQEFGFESRTVTAPSYTWSVEQEKLLFEYGVRSIETIPLQKIPSGDSKKYNSKIRYTKAPSNHTVGYIQRNVFFEPSLFDISIKSIMKRIEYAFANKKPAIIGTHRINFMGSLYEENRNSSLSELTILLKALLKKWPDVQFIDSETLLTYMLNQDKNY